MRRYALAQHYVYEGGRPGRPKTKIESSPPKGFSRHLGLMKRLDSHGWYRQLEERRQFERTNLDPRDPDDQRLRRVTDPNERDRVMCRSEVVAVCDTLDDLEIARLNGRLVLEIDPSCPKEILLEKISTILEVTRNRKARRISTKAWGEHRILALYDLKLLGYDLSKDRKQLSAWLFPEIDDEKQRGNKFDRAIKYLGSALSSLNTIRAQRA
jgi:hypothetical protein